MKRFLAHAAVMNGTACRNAYVEFSSDGVTVKPFEEETHSTVFVPGILYIIKGVMDEEERINIAAQVKSSCCLEDALNVIIALDKCRRRADDTSFNYYIFLR